MRGNITRRGKHSWRIKIDLERGEDGKRRTLFRTVRGKRADAEAAMSAILHDHARGDFVEPTQTTFAEHARKWLALQASKVAPKTHDRHTEIVEKHLVPALGMHRVQKLTATMIDAYYAKALIEGRRDGKGGLSAQTVVHHHRVIFSVLKHAARKRVVTRNVAQEADPPKPDNRDVQALDEAQTARVIIAAEGSIWYAPLLLSASTGLRRGEVLGLRWRDIDLERAKIHVAQTVQQVGEKIITKEPKTSGSRRAVTLPTFTVDALRRHRAAQAEQRLALGLPREDTAFVFADALGEPLKPSNMTKAFERIREKVGVPRVSLHALRHSHASHLLKSGVNPKVVSERLGHSKVNITLDLYSKVLPGLQEEAADITDAVMRTALAQNKTTS